MAFITLMVDDGSMVFLLNLLTLRQDRATTFLFMVRDGIDHLKTLPDRFTTTSAA